MNAANLQSIAALAQLANNPQAAGGLNPVVMQNIASALASAAAQTNGSSSGNSSMSGVSSLSPVSLNSLANGMANHHQGKRGVRRWNFDRGRYARGPRRAALTPKNSLVHRPDPDLSSGDDSGLVRQPDSDSEPCRQADRRSGRSQPLHLSSPSGVRRH